MAIFVPSVHTSLDNHVSGIIFEREHKLRMHEHNVVKYATTPWNIGTLIGDKLEYPCYIVTLIISRNKLLQNDTIKYNIHGF